MFKIGEFSKLSSISIRMLRYYDEKNILKPEYVDPSSGFRYYLAKQLNTVGKIQKLKSLGFSLAAIRKMLVSDDLKAHFEVREEELREELISIQTQGRMLESIKDSLESHDSLMPYSVILKNLPKRRVISIRRQVLDYYQEEKLWDALDTFCKQHDVKFADNSYPMAIYHDPEYKEKYVDIEVQCTIRDSFKQISNDQFDIKIVEKIQVASVTFPGAYELMPFVTEAIAQWIEDNDYTMSGPMFNIFHVSPATEKDPNKYITEACIEVKKEEV